MRQRALLTFRLDNYILNNNALYDFCPHAVSPLSFPYLSCLQPACGQKWGICLIENVMRNTLYTQEYME
jgi:hypothetical protein